MERSHPVAVDTKTGRTSSAYVPRRPEESVLYRAVAGELGGLSLVRNAVAQGRRAAQYARQPVGRGDR